MLTFLEVNGYRVPVSDPVLAGWIVGLSAGMSFDELANALRSEPILEGCRPTRRRATGCRRPSG